VDRLLEVDKELKLIRARLNEIKLMDEPEGDEVTRSKQLELRATETDDLLTRHDVLVEERVPLIARAQRLEDVAAAARDEARVEAGDGSRYLGGTGPSVRPGFDPYEEREISMIRANRYDTGDIITRARRAVEQAPRHLNEKGREHVATLLTQFAEDEDSRQAPLIARHILLTGSPEYHKQFREYMRTGFPGDLLRANMSLTDSAGGYLVKMAS
jgi:hypothetical protein